MTWKEFKELGDKAIKNDKAETPIAHWLDIARLTTSGKPVMEVPDFEAEPRGPADKPRR